MIILKICFGILQNLTLVVKKGIHFLFEKSSYLFLKILFTYKNGANNFIKGFWRIL